MAGFQAVREFRGVAYHIAVRRQGAGSTVSLLVDGKPVEGGVVPLPPVGCAGVKVEVALG